MDKKHLNEFDKEYINNGCGPAYLLDSMNKWLKKIVTPLFNLIFANCCCGHDIDIFLGVTRKDFNKANKDFYTCLKWTTKNKAPWRKRWYFYWRSWLYYKLVSSRAGWKAFLHEKEIDKDGNIVAMDLKDLPSYQVFPSTKVKSEKVWIKNRWWLKKECAYVNGQWKVRYGSNFK